MMHNTREHYVVLPTKDAVSRFYRSLFTLEEMIEFDLGQIVYNIVETLEFLDYGDHVLQEHASSYSEIMHRDINADQDGALLDKAIYELGIYIYDLFKQYGLYDSSGLLGYQFHGFVGQNDIVMIRYATKQSSPT